MENPRMNCVADDLHRCPLADRGSSRRTHGNAVTNPRIRVCLTVALTVLPRHCASLSRSCDRDCSSMPQNWFSNRVFKSFNDIVDHCYYAWNTLIDQPWKIMTVARRELGNHGLFNMTIGTNRFLTPEHIEKIKKRGESIGLISDRIIDHDGFRTPLQ
jgi:hypothetical protein